jgi:hypothetical protein
LGEHLADEGAGVGLAASAEQRAECGEGDLRAETRDHHRHDHGDRLAQTAGEEAVPGA